MMIGRFIRNAIGGGGGVCVCLCGGRGVSEKAQVTGTPLMDTIPGEYRLEPHWLR